MTSDSLRKHFYFLIISFKKTSASLATHLFFLVGSYRKKNNSGEDY